MSGRQPEPAGGWQAHPRGFPTHTTGYGPPPGYDPQPGYERRQPHHGPRPGYGHRPDGDFRPSTRRGAAAHPAPAAGGARRRYSELIVPGSVILVGVLAVVAFGVIVHATMRPDNDPQALPPARPPALGTIPPIPSDDPAVPIPDASAPPTPAPQRTSPSATPPPRRATSRPPAPVRSPAPPRGQVTISQGSVPRRVDLTAEGRRDWVHWGQQDTFSLERHKDGGFAILEGTPTAPRFRHALSEQRFSWVDGSPVDSSSGTPTGIRTCGSGNGFTISAPADTSEHRLRLYVGVLFAKGRMQARLPGAGGTVSAVLESRSPELKTAVFTIKYRAGASGTVKLSWVTEKSFDTDCGGVALEAATLS